MAHDLTVDLNLLVPLAALLEERHISRAATRLQLSQPATSRALARLRRLFDDELLVRGSGGYHLTPRAERLQRQLQALLPTLNTVFAAETFDPATAGETFRLSGTDYAALILAPTLFPHLFRESPGSAVSFIAWHDHVLDDLERGTLDLLFNGAAAPAHLHTQKLFQERFLCVMAATHPLATRDQLSLQEYLDCDHIVIDVRNGDQTVIDDQLSTLGVQRTASLRLPYHLAAPPAIGGTDLIATLPERLTTSLRTNPDLHLTAAPQQIGAMTYYMSWHPRLDHDPGHRWLRDTITELVH